LVSTLAVLYDQHFIDDLNKRADLVRRVCLFLVVCIATVGHAAAQESPRAVLVDEFDSIPCEDLKARTDSFVAELSQNPADVGYVLLPFSEKRPSEIELIVRAHLFTRQFERSRIRFVHSSKAGMNVNQFWRVPPGADLPESEAINAEDPDSSTAFLFGRSERHDLAGVCPTFSPEDFSDLILRIPGSKARLVIFGPSASSRRMVANDELETFRTYTNLSPKQIEFFFVHRPSLPYTETEYWYIPPKEK
jgi:hypothetical protein